MTTSGPAPERQGGAAGVSGDVCIRLDAAGDGRHGGDPQNPGDAGLFRSPILMLTAKDREMDIVQGLDNGADDYMTKPFGILELSARVRNLLKRVEPAKEEVSSLTIGEVSINRETREVIACGDRTELTLKEFELLTYLMEHINRVVTRDELLDHIWGYDYDGETRTLDMHIKTLRQKLHDAGAQIKTVRGVGYRF